MRGIPLGSGGVPQSKKCDLSAPPSSLRQIKKTENGLQTSFRVCPATCRGAQTESIRTTTSMRGGVLEENPPGAGPYSYVNYYLPLLSRVSSIEPSFSVYNQQTVQSSFRCSLQGRHARKVSNSSRSGFNSTWEIWVFKVYLL